jgi:hypothetical protein
VYLIGAAEQAAEVAQLRAGWRAFKGSLAADTAARRRELDELRAELVGRDALRAGLVRRSTIIRPLC